MLTCVVEEINKTKKKFRKKKKKQGKMFYCCVDTIRKHETIIVI